MAWGLAAYTLWANIVLNAGEASGWLLALFAASIGEWARRFPARYQSVMLARAALLLLGALVVHLHAGSGGAVGPYFFWPVVISIFYGLLLATPAAALLSLLAMVEFGLSCWLTQPSLPWRQVLEHGGFLALFPPLFIVLGGAMRQPDQRAESSLRDNRTLLYNESGFFVHGGVLLEQCRKQGRPFSMVLLDASDLRDTPKLLGRKVANDLFGQVVRAIGAVPGEGIAARTDSFEFALLLPGVSAERAAELIQQRLGRPPRVEVKIQASPVTLVLGLSIAQSKDKAQGIEELYDFLHGRQPATSTPAATARETLNLKTGVGQYSGVSGEVSPTVALPL